MTSTAHLVFFALAILSSANSLLGADNDTQSTVVSTPNITTTILPNITTATSTARSTIVTTTKDVPTSVAPTTVPPTTAVPTTAQPTTPPPHPKEYTWEVKDINTGKICIIAQMKIQLDIPYTNVSNKIMKSVVKVPGNATGSGSCDSLNPAVSQTLVLQWGNANATSNLTLVFASNSTSKQFWLESIAAEIAVDNVTFPRIQPKTKVVKMLNSSRHFITPMNKSYSCASTLNIQGDLTPQVVNHTGHFTFDHFQLEAFKNSTTNGFSTAIYCDGDNAPDLVPILVGCTLVGLVVIVLGVYLWGRRRSQQRGYLSMLGQPNN